jgi:hypothetical protein
VALERGKPTFGIFETLKSTHENEHCTIGVNVREREKAQERRLHGNMRSRLEGRNPRRD